MADWRKALLNYLQVPVTKQNLEFLDRWQRWEGGHTHNSASYNWLNTTRNTVGAVRSINSVGVKAYDSFQNGIAAMGDTLKNGMYGDVLDALGSGNPFKSKPVAGLSTWLSGGPNTESGRLYAAKVLGSGYSGGAKVGNYAPPRVNTQFKVPKLKNPPGWNQLVKDLFQGDPEMISWLLENDKNPTADGNAIQQSDGVRAGTVVGFAQSQLGLPYKFGTEAPGKSFDCSGLIQWAYGAAGYKIPRTTFEQIRVGRKVAWDDLQPGDLIFPSTHHVVMYVGNGKVIAAPHTGTNVQYQDVNNFRNPVMIRRIMP